MQRSNLCRTALLLALMFPLYALADGETQINWEPEIEPDNQVFPSMVISMATTKSGSWPFFGRIESCPPNSKVKLVIKCDELMEPSSAEVTSGGASAPLAIAVRPNWKFSALRAIRQQAPQNVTFDLMVGGRNAGRKVQTVTVHSINDCLFAATLGSGKSMAMSHNFAAYVNEDHPAIDRLLKEALSQKIVPRFDGYHSKDDRIIAREVYAVWHVLELRGIKYSSIVTTPNTSSRVFCQHVRFIEESLGNTEANCVDGSVMVASMLQKIGLRTGLVKVPGHMFVVFCLDEGGKKPVYLESTCLGMLDIPATAREHPIAGLLDLNWKKRASARTFAAALRAADAEVKEIREKQEQMTKDGKTDATFATIIWIPDARKAGFTPIPYQALR